MTDLFTGSDPALARLASTDAAMVRARDGVMNKKIENIKQIEAAAKDFESMFVSEMLRPMFEGIGDDPMFGGGQAESTWRSLMIDEYGKQITRSGGIGISDAIKASMIEMQGGMPSMPAANYNAAIAAYEGEVK